MEILSKSTKKMARNAFPNILQLLLLFFIIIVFKPGLKMAIIIILSANLSLWAYSAIKLWPVKKKVNDLYIGSISIIIFISVIYYLNYFFGAWGFWGLLLIAVLIVIYKMIRRWDEFIAVKHEGERALFGTTIKEKYGDKKEEENGK